MSYFMFVPRSHPCSWWSVTLTWHFSGANPTLSSAQGEGACSAPAQPPAQRFYPNLANLVTAQRPVLFTAIVLNPLATVVILHFPGTTKGYSLSPSLFPGGRSSGVRAPSSPAEQSCLPLPVSWALARHFLQR